MKIDIPPPQTFLEFLKATHEDLLDHPQDMEELNVHENFDVWLERMTQEEMFGWVEVFRDDEVSNFSENILPLRRAFIGE